MDDEGENTLYEDVSFHSIHGAESEGNNAEKSFEEPRPSGLVRAAEDESFHELESESGLPPERQYLCDICSKEYRTACGLKRHLSSHAGTLKYKCRTCFAMFANRGQYEGHVNTHNEISPYRCDRCLLRFRYKSSLLRHVKHCRGIPPKTDQYVCDLCSETFNRKDILADHISGKHENERRYKCLVCSVSFSWRSSFNKHKQSKKHREKTTSLLE